MVNKRLGSDIQCLGERHRPATSCVILGNLLNLSGLCCRL